MLILLEENITTEPLSSVAKFMAIHSILVETFNYKKMSTLGLVSKNLFQGTMKGRTKF